MKNAVVKVLSFAVVAMVGLSASAATTYTIEAGDVDDLMAKVNGAASGDVIELEPGVYDFTGKEPMVAKDNRSAFLLISGVNITIRGKNTKHWSEKTPSTEDAVGEEVVLKGDGTARLLYGYAGTGRDSKVYHITFENGNSTSSGGGQDGGAIYYMGNSWGFATNCVFRNCTANNGGGTFCVTSYDCLYENCTATSNGGGAYGDGNVSYNSPTNRYESCVFNGCSANQGGGLFANQMRMLGNRARGGYVEGCVFTNNTAKAGGGAILGSSGTSTAPGGMDFINDCSFVDNKVTAGDGGAIYGSKLESITNCRFKDNTASNAGGAVYLGTGSEDVPLEGCSFIGNTATSGHGGAVCAAKRIAVVTNCIFACNKAGNHGGALSTETHIGSIVDSTFVSNVAAQAGGAIRTMGTVTSADRCTFSDNAATSGAGGVNMAVTSGIFTDCVFHSNTNNETLYGAHVPLALKMVRCQFSGYGDVCARDYDSCIFSNCVYRYTSPTYGADGHGLITYPYAIGNGSIRNCLVHDCLVSRIIASEGVTVDIENSTFADNCVEDVPQAGYGTHAIMFFAFRQNNYTMSTNKFVNCIFADNWQLGQGAIDAYFQGSAPQTSGGVTRNSCTQISNCIYRTSYVSSSSGVTLQSNFNKGDPKFVKANAKFAGKYPNYMICRDSAAADKGAVLGWHAGGKDLLGNPRVHGTAVDIGAYESILPVAYVGEVDYETLEEAIGAAGVTKRIGLYGDARLDNWEQVAAERYFLEPNGHTVTAPSGADVQCVKDTLSVKVSGIYETAGDFNIMPGNIAELTNAIKQANNSDVIVLSPGTYDLSELQEYREPAGATGGAVVWGTACAPDAYEKSSLVVNKPLTYKGAYAGSWRDQTDDEGRRTILKGTDNMRIFYGFTSSGRGSTFYHLTFENGRSSGQNGIGGAIYFMGNSNGFATNCVFRNCSASSGGGTYCVTSYDCLYENCSAVKVGNTDTGCGGGAFGNGSADYNAATNRYAACVFIGCSADENGGGLYAKDLRMLGNRKTGGYIDGCVFTNNTATSGGAIYGSKVDVLTNCRFVDNHTSTGTGGAFHLATACNGVASNCTFVGNSSRLGGAVGQCDYIYDSVFTDNWATNNGVTKEIGGGGAIANALGMFGCTFSNNVAYVLSTSTVGGGAAYNCNGTNCRFENNRSTYQGGAVYYASGNTGNYTNCQFVGNTSGNHGGAAWYGTYVNCEFDGNTGAGTGNGGAGYGVKCYDCKIVNNKTLGHRGGGVAKGTCFDCVFSNNCCATGARGGASAWSNGTRCKFYGIGDVSVGCFADCEFDGIVATNSNQSFVFDSLENNGGSTYITNCLIHNCEVAQIFHCDGRTMEAVNCTIVDNKLKKFGSYNALVAVCNLGVAYNPAGNHVSTNRLINCLFANNTADGARLDLSVWVTTADTYEGVPCTSELINCMYEEGSSFTGGIVKENSFQGRARFNKGSYANQPYYALRYGSEARNKGKNFPWMETGKDLAGKNRIIDGIVDIGCYECDMLPLGLILKFQ